jgi:hypothetical protein
MNLLAPQGTDWFTFVFWTLRKTRLGPGGGFASSAIHVVRNEAPASPGETRTLAAELGPPMRVELRYDSGTDPLAPLPFGLMPANRLSDLLPVYDLPDRWLSAADAGRDLTSIFGSPPEPSWSDVHDPAVLTRLATQGIGAHLLQRRSGHDGGESPQTPGREGYEIDLLSMARYPVRAPFEPYGARLLLSADLAPEAIERDGVSARPGDPEWDRFVLAFEASLATWITAADHSFTVHFAMAGTLVLALRLGLPEGHPLRDVLTPFTFATVSVNSSGVYSLLAEHAYFSRIFSFTYEGLCTFTADAAEATRWQTLPERLEAQGLTGPGAPALETLPFAADGLLWWDAIDRFVTVMLDRWADPADPAPARLVSTWMDLLPQARFTADGPRPALQRMLSTAIFWITVMHELVGDVIAYVQDPTWMPVKIRPGFASDQTLVKHDSMQKMILGVLTAEIEMPLILDDLSLAFTDPEMSRAWASFQADLRTVATEIAARNGRRAHAFDTLAPERIHVSVSL